MEKWIHKGSTVGTTLTSLLSCAACPLCFPIYAGLLSACGVELYEINGYFFPLMIAFLIITLFLMVRQKRAHSLPHRPLILAFGAASGIIASAYYGHEWFLYISIALFIGATFWNKRLISVHKKDSCCTA